MSDSPLSLCCLCAACVLPVCSTVTRSVNTKDRSKFYLFQVVDKRGSGPRSMLFITQLCNYSNSLVTTPTYFEGLKGLLYSNNKQVATFASVGSSLDLSLSALLARLPNCVESKSVTF